MGAEEIDQNHWELKKYCEIVMKIIAIASGRLSGLAGVNLSEFTGTGQTEGRLYAVPEGAQRPDAGTEVRWTAL